MLTDSNEEDSISEVPIATSNPFRPPVYATGCFRMKLSKRLENDILLLPEGPCERWNTEMQILLGTSRMGLIYIGTSLAKTLDLQLKDPYIEGVAFDACIIASGQPVQILTFVRTDLRDKYHSFLKRNDELCRCALYSLREFTDESFNIVNGVLDLDDLRDKAGFKDKIKALTEESSRYVNPRSLEMSPSKCKNLRKAFVVASALDHASSQTSSDRIVLLKWNEPMENENHPSNETKIAQAEEVSTSLSHSGTTMLGGKRGKKPFCSMFDMFSSFPSPKFIDGVLGWV